MFKPPISTTEALHYHKAKAATDDIKKVPGAPIKFLELDLGSFYSVKKGAGTFAQESDRLDILMPNAGIESGESSVPNKEFLPGPSIAGNTT
ncbi:hypothetical protein F5X99DRAFT_407697 [Biscogniauxia marginata]|nr:hypothetical protein F5X99DRAFT_407697 [Biscogniauxia marginata]